MNRNNFLTIQIILVTDVSFPQDGSNSGTTIVRTGANAFNLTEIGTYQVLFQVSVTEAAQLILTLNGADLEYTVAGRATGTSQIIGMAIVETTSANSILTVRNPAGNASAITITPLAGGTRPVSAHLTITRIMQHYDSIVIRRRVSKKDVSPDSML